MYAATVAQARQRVEHILDATDLRIAQIKECNQYLHEVLAAADLPNTAYMVSHLTEDNQSFDIAVDAKCAYSARLAAAGYTLLGGRIDNVQRVGVPTSRLTPQKVPAYTVSTMTRCNKAMLELLMVTDSALGDSLNQQLGHRLDPVHWHKILMRELSAHRAPFTEVMDGSCQVWITCDWPGLVDGIEQERIGYMQHHIWPPRKAEYSVYVLNDLSTNAVTLFINQAVSGEAPEWERIWTELWPDFAALVTE